MRAIHWCAAIAALSMTTLSQAEETHPGITQVPLEVKVAEDTTLHGVLTRPEGVERPPVIQFVQWLSCSTVMLSAERDDGWSQMLRRIVRDSGYAVVRVDKRGVGKSDGDCAALDFETELADYRKVFDTVRERDDLDTSRIVVFGGSMGSRYAPLVAEGRNGVDGVLVWGGGALTWFERMLLFDRHAMELSGDGPATVNSRMKQQARLHTLYLMEGLDPKEIFERDASLEAAWSRTIGTSDSGHYGRPFDFHQQAQRADWARAWAEIEVPVLAVQGEYDWFENPEGGRTIERLAPNGRFVVIPRMDHHFSLFDTPQAAFRDEGGTADAEPFLRIALPWLRERAEG